MSVNKPNILWICTEQQRYDTISVLGNKYINTPNLDRLVRNGIAFRNAYCQTPICTPSRSSFLTGMYPSAVHGCQNGNDHWIGSAPLVTKILADYGYKCGLIGKLHLAGMYGRIEPRGDDGYEYIQRSSAPIDIWEKGHDYADWVKSKGHKLGDFIKPPKGDNYIEIEEGVPSHLHQTTWCAEKSIEFIEGNNSLPWLLSVNPFDPHPPFNPPEDYLLRYNYYDLPEALFRESDLENQLYLKNIDFQTKCNYPSKLKSKELKAAYYAMIELIDENVGKIIDSLERTGQLENTIIIFMSDHGEMLGDHGLLLKGCRFYESLTKVPLIISWPKGFKRGIISDALVELIDIVPTLLDINSFKISKRMQGKSLVPILTGKNESNIFRKYVRCEYYRALNPDIPTRPHFNGTYATMLRDERYKIVVYHGHEVGELYDLKEDPGEFNNLWNNKNYDEIKFILIKKNFDASAFAVDVGSEQSLPW
jgi:arylsulfatase A-like enzyme